MSVVSEQAWRDFAANTASLEGDSASIHSKHLNKWIGHYKGEIVAVADSFDGVEAILASKGVPTGETLIRFVGQKEMTLILWRQIRSPD